MKKQFLKICAPLMLSALFFVSCTKVSNEDNSWQYLSVQLAEGDNWSIIDANGKVIVDREYPSDNRLSPITNNGTYWVYSNTEEKYQLFSIDSPKRPIINTEYAQASNFVNGISFVCDGENPIQIIDEDGEIINTLSKEICEVYLPNNPGHFNTFLFKDKSGRYGYLDRKGNIRIPAKYIKAENFSGGYALVKRDNSSTELDIIDPNGNVVYGRINEALYDVDYDSYFSEGKIAVLDKSKYNSLVYLNEKGKIAFQHTKTYMKGDSYKCGEDGFAFKDGIAVVVDEKENVCVLDEKDECMIRPGKYSAIYYLGNGQFAVEQNKSGRWRIVDKNDNSVSTKDFSLILPIKLGDNYIAYDEGTFSLVSPKGENVNHTSFHNADASAIRQINYVDVEQIVAELIQDIDSTGYLPLKGKTRPKEIAKIFNQTPQESLRYKRYIDLPDRALDAYSAEVSVNFDARAQVEKTHEETVDDGWFAYKRTVSDGWDWNDNAQIKSIYIKYKEFYVDNSFKQNLRKKLGNALMKKGFKQLDSPSGYEAQNGNFYTAISFDDESITIYPNRTFSELNAY